MLNKKEIEKRISATNEAGLVTILYEALIDNFKDSIKVIDEGNYNELNSINKNSRDIIAELLATLQGDSDIAKDLREIYISLNKIITEAETQRDKVSFKMAIKIVEPLQSGFKELEREIDPKVVTGITYGKTNLDEYQVNGNRTFEG